MGKKSRNKRNRNREEQAQTPVQPGTPVAVSRKPEIPAFWVALAIPLVCAVGAWTKPPVATPMELKSYASQIYMAGLLLLWFWLQRNSRNTTLSFSPVRICLGLLFIVGTLSIFWSSNADFWIYKWNKWFAGFAIFLLGYQISQNEKNLDTIVKLSILGALITALIGIAQYLFNFSQIPQTSFPSSTFGNGNMAGQVMVLTASLPFYFLFKERISVEKVWFYAFSLALILAYVYYTRTRAVWLACIFELLLISTFVIFDKVKRKNWLFWDKNKTWAFSAAIVLFFVLINFDSSGFQPFWEIAAFELSSIATSINTSAQESGGQRYLIWGVMLQMIKDNPILGSGLGNFFDIYNTGGYAEYRIMGVQRGHNDVLELIVEIGLLGLLLFLGIIVSMCILLYRLYLKSEGFHRLLFALLTFSVTASMMNAQLSFPYQLPVPLLIMPFFLAIIIRGAENIDPAPISIPVKKWFNQAALISTSTVFIFFSVNDLLWMRDINLLNQVVAGKINGPWEPVNPIFNQAYITGTRSVVQAVRNTNQTQMGLYVLEPVLQYWPDVAANTLIASESYIALRRYDEAEYWANKTIENQPEGSYIGEFFLMNILIARGEMEKVRAIYDAIKDDPEELLSQNRNAYNMLHSMSINLQDFERTTYYFEKFSEYFGEVSEVIGNQAIFLINTGRTLEAVPHMRRALELNPNLPSAALFNNLLMQIPNQ